MERVQAKKGAAVGGAELSPEMRTLIAAFADGLQKIAAAHVREQAAQQGVHAAAHGGPPSDVGAHRFEKHAAPPNKFAHAGKPSRAPAAPHAVSVRQFESALGAARWGTVDTHSMGPQLREALAGAGIGEDEVTRMAGPDGLLRGREFSKLYARLPPSERTTTGAVFNALKAEVARSAADPRLAQPDAAKAHGLHPFLTLDAEVMPEADRVARDLGLAAKSQYAYAAEYKAAHPDDTMSPDHFCKRTCDHLVDSYLREKLGNNAPRAADWHSAIQVATAEDTKGRIQADPLQAQIGRNYIDSCLDKGYPVTVGVSFKDREAAGGKEVNNDRITDHFVVVSGRGHEPDGRTYYAFKDPADGSTGKFYVDRESGVLFRAPRQPGKDVDSKQYQVSQVRTYNGVY